ncbi:MAG: zinc-ribbon domain-containing protein [Desulfovibrio sp.]|jgi:predicted Zn finger-like uncharacterized protein|nr:zinc-ribbon domain-containing protein [Desulfovibrio sp.]
MIIRCPECQFERSIDSSKIPSSAAIATCPKCRHRFRFRALAPDENPDVPSAGHAARAAQAPHAPQAGDMVSRRAPDDAVPGTMPHAGPAMDHDEADDLPAAFRRGPSATSPPPAPGMSGTAGSSGTEDAYAGEDDHVGEPRPVSGTDTPRTADPDASRTAPYPSGTTPSDADTSRTAHGHTDLSRPGDDPLPPGAVIPGRSSAPAHDNVHDDGHDDGHDAPNGRNDAVGPGGGQRRPGSPRDIWDAVASVGDRWRKQSESRTRPGNGGENDRDGAPNSAPGGWNAGNHDDSHPPRDGGHPGERDAPLPPWAASARSEVPWENLDRVGFFPGLYQTILRVMLAAPRFFSGVRSSGSLKRPVAFYLLIGIFQALTERLWYLMSMRAFGGFIEDPQLHAWMGSVTHDMSLPMTLLISPFTLLLQLAVLSGLYHLMIRLVEPRAADLPTTVRVISYSAAPTVLSVVPLVGPVVGSLWFVVCTFVGVKYAHRLPWSRTALAIGPLLGLGFALTVQLLRMFMSSAPM